MNILCFYGSPKHQNMEIIKSSLSSLLEYRGHSVTFIDKSFSPCINCGSCIKSHKCSLKDGFPNDLLDSCDGIIIMSPIYFFGLNAKSKAFLDRLYSTNLNNKLLTCITLSGSPTRSKDSGFDLIINTFKRISKFCGSIYVKPLNVVTKDSKLEHIPIKDIKKFIDRLERGE